VKKDGKTLTRCSPGPSPGSWKGGRLLKKSRIFTVNFKYFFCVANFHGQFQRLFPNGRGRSVHRTPCSGDALHHSTGLHWPPDPRVIILTYMWYIWKGLHSTRFEWRRPIHASKGIHLTSSACAIYSQIHSQKENQYNSSQKPMMMMFTEVACSITKYKAYHLAKVGVGLSRCAWCMSYHMPIHVVHDLSKTLHNISVS
jgi:hypothetical protein